MTKRAAEVKSKFKNRFNELLGREPLLRQILDSVFRSGSAYVVGGFFRDVLNGIKSRDIDIIVDLKSKPLTELLNELNCEYTINRFQGVKIKLNSITLDIWEIDNNWAFRQQVVKKNPNNILGSIARGCFFNYDSLVIDLSSFKYNLKYYNEFLSSQKLDILNKIKSI